MSEYITYIHNVLELMVATGNPKGIKGAADLGRDDLVQSHPNPLTEGIFKFYGSKLLRDLGIYSQVTADKECKSCWAIEGKTWFTSRHHRETPQRIEEGTADVGIVWATEVAHGKATDRKIDGVEIVPPYKGGYAIGALGTGRNADNGNRFLAYLGTQKAQDIYASYGFVSANAQELTIKPIPDAK